MTLLADRLLAMNQRDSKSPRMIVHAQELLRVPTSIDQLGKADRFVVTKKFHDYIGNSLNESEDDSLLLSLRNARPLLPQFWLELEDGKTGWLFDGDQCTCYFLLGGPSNRVDLVGTIDLREYRNVSAEMHVGLTQVGSFYSERWPSTTIHILKGPSIAAVISNQRHVEISKPIHRTAAERVMMRRRLGHDHPIFSYKRVNLILPQTVHYRGEERDIGSFEGMRGHLVIGHWRLIDGVAEPFWTWIDGHERGDRDLGWITKERRVTVTDDLVHERRGFLIPADIGQHGERRIARRTMEIAHGDSND